MKIGELAQIAQCTVETVRYYEKAGLLPEPGRTVSNYRSYGDGHVERLQFIRNCRALDMTHHEIRRMLDLIDQCASDCAGVNQVLDEHIAHVDVRIAELSQLRHQLQALRESCRHGQPIDACGILQGLASMKAELRQQRHTHLG